MRSRLVAPLALVALAVSAPAQVVISEIMYHPDGGSEFIELLSTSTTPVDLAGWRLTDAVEFTFTAGTTLEAGQRVVVAREPEMLSGALGPWDGKLSNRAETIRLVDAGDDEIDSVRYADDGPWPGTADGDGPSLELINASLPNEHPEIWTAGPIGGTPGAPNASHDDLPLPFASDIRHSPLVPTSSDPIEVSAVLHGLVLPPSGWLLWRREGEIDFHNVAMSNSAGRVVGIIPQQPDDTVIEFALRVEQSFGKEPFRIQPSTWPLINCHVEIDDDDLAPSTRLHRLVMTQARWDELRSRDPMSDDLLPATVISGGVAYHGVGLRYRGSNNRVEVEEESFRINFNDAERLDGSIRALNLNGFFAERQWLSMDLFERRGMLAPHVEMVSVVADGEYLPICAQVEKVDEDFLERTLGDDSIPLFRGRDTADLRFRGSDPSLYEPDYDAVTDAADHTDIVALCEAFEAPTDEEFIAAMLAQIDVEQWLTFFAINAVLSNQEGSIYRDTGDDYFLVRHPATGLFQIIPWDMDSTFLFPEETLFRPTLPAIVRLTQHPVWGRRYVELVQGLQASLASADAMESRIALLPTELPDWRSDRVRGFSRGRPRSLRAQVPSRLSAGGRGVRADYVWGLEERLSVIDLITPNQPWRYLLGTSEPASGWQAPGFDDSAWAQGLLPIGYGDDENATILTHMQGLHSTVYLRRTVTVEQAFRVTQIQVDLDCDDGCILWINGAEVSRVNVTGDPGASGTADGARDGGDPETLRINDAIGLLQEGENTLAIMLLNQDIEDDDLTLDAQLRMSRRPGCGVITGPDSMVTIGGVAPLPLTWGVEVGGQYALVDSVTGAWEATFTSEPALNTLEAIARTFSGTSVDRATVRWVWGDELIEFGGRLPPNDPTVVRTGDVVHITASTELPAEAIMVVQPGAVIAFDLFSSLILNGRAEFEGTAEDPITLLPFYSHTPWAGVGVAPGNPGAEFSHVEVLMGGADVIPQFGLAGTMSVLGAHADISHSAFRFCYDKGIVIALGSGVISDCYFHNLSEAINVQASAATIENCYLTEGIGVPPKDGIDIDAQPGGPTVLSDNLIVGGPDDGIDIGLSDTITIVGNTVIDVGDKGISLSGGNAFIYDNVFADAGIGAAIKDGAVVHFARNTVVGADVGMDLYEDLTARGGPDVLVDDSVIWGWSEASVRLDALSEVEIVRSDVMGGVTASGEENFDADPMFVDPEGFNFHPREGSPLIGVGDGGGDVGARPAEPATFDGFVTF
jgi:CotH protein/lamin tail-like protein/parallel beta helix pectate lyase-like protein